MKKLVLTGMLLLGGWITASSQHSFTFEDETVPSQWVAEQGTLTLSTEHMTEGTQSLCWEVPAGQKASMLINFTSFRTSVSYASIFDIYSLQATESPLTVEFLNGSKEVQHTANVTINFKGWREFNRAYGYDFKSKVAKTLAYVRFTLDNTALSSPQKLFFDDVNFKGSTNSSRQAMDLMVKDVQYIQDGCKDLLQIYAFEPDIELTTPTQEELNDITSIKGKYPYTPTPAETPRVLRDVRNYVGTLDIVRNADGSIKGNSIITSSTDLTTTKQRELLIQLNALAASSTDGDSELFRDFLDLVIDQGVMYQYPQLPSNNYSVVREYPQLLLNLLPKSTEEQQTEILKMVRWISEAGWAYPDTDYLSTEFSSDIMYNYLSHFLSYAAYQPDTKIAVRELKAMSRFMERIVAPVSGGYDTVKPDGVGFHHGTHYNNYMYAYNGWTDAVYNLKGTAFRISETAYNYMKKAVLACYIMSNRSNTGSNYYANSLSGRHPLDGGHVNQFSKAYLEKFIEIGTDIFGMEDTELTSAYNYFLLSDKYNAPEADYTGFYQFNYSPIGVYRGNDWVVTMRAPTTRMWGAEIYSGTSRFSRYQSHGTMEVVYSGALTNSGLPLSPTGYDWNVAPGGTTVHYTSWREMMPKQNTTQRFDQFTATKDFAGALAWGNYGMFACDFDQIDTWGGQCFTPTNLVFKKSVYAFDGMLISLGSNISSSGSYGDDRVTATNLFQEVGSDMGNLNINGTMMSSGDADKELSSETDTWIVTPKGTGYFIPKGNDNIVVKYGEQEGPNEDGSDVDSPAIAIATKAYINHGVKPTDKNYTFVMVPQTTAEKMQNLASELTNGGGERYTILSQTDKFHALTYKPAGITAYAFFEAVDDTKLSVVKAVGSEMLLMQRPQSDGSLHLAVCNPNLRPQSKSSSLGDWLPGTTETSITLEGEWYTDMEAEGFKINAPENGQTVIELTLNHGLPIYIQVGPEGYTSSIDSEEIEGDWLRVFRSGEEMVVELTKPSSNATFVELYSIDGTKTKSEVLNSGIQKGSIKLQQGNAVQILRVRNGDKVKVLKCIH